MMMKAVTACFVLISLLAQWPVAARAQEEEPERKVLSIELAFDHIDVTSGFSGAQIEVFGHRRDKYTDVAIILKGPEKNIIVWKKAQILGAWINRYGIRFKKIPLYYAYAHNEAEVFSDPGILAETGLGMEGLMKGKAIRKNPSTNTASYEAALIASMRAKKVFAEAPEKIRFINDYFFRTRFLIPANAPTGTYKIHSFLFKNGQVTERDTDTLKVEQVGMNAFVHDAAHDHALPYALVCVFIALISGWFVGILRVRP